MEVAAYVSTSDNVCWCKGGSSTWNPMRQYSHRKDCEGSISDVILSDTAAGARSMATAPFVSMSDTAGCAWSVEVAAYINASETEGGVIL